MRVYIVWREVMGRTLMPEATFYTEEEVLDYINHEMELLADIAKKFGQSSLKFHYKSFMVGANNE